MFSHHFPLSKPCFPLVLDQIPAQIPILEPIGAPEAGLAKMTKSHPRDSTSIAWCPLPKLFSTFVFNIPKTHFMMFLRHVKKIEHVAEGGACRSATQYGLLDHRPASGSPKFDQIDLVTSRRDFSELRNFPQNLSGTILIHVPKKHFLDFFDATIIFSYFPCTPWSQVCHSEFSSGAGF